MNSNGKRGAPTAAAAAAADAAAAAAASGYSSSDEAPPASKRHEAAEAEQPPPPAPYYDAAEIPPSLPLGPGHLAASAATPPVAGGGSGAAGGAAEEGAEPLVREADMPRTAEGWRSYVRLEEPALGEDGRAARNKVHLQQDDQWPIEWLSASKAHTSRYELEFCMTPEAVQELHRARRRYQNREAARRSRHRHKDRCGGMEK